MQDYIDGLRTRAWAALIRVASESGNVGDRMPILRMPRPGDDGCRIEPITWKMLSPRELQETTDGLAEMMFAAWPDPSQRQPN